MARFLIASPNRRKNSPNNRIAKKSLGKNGELRLSVLFWTAKEHCICDASINGRCKKEVRGNCRWRRTGLGATLVRKLVSEDCSIGMLARSSEFIGKLATEIGRSALAIPTDVSNPKQVAAAFHKVRQQLGPVEILIASASGSVGEGLTDTTPEQFERSWRIGVCGAFLCAREAVLDILERGGGAIIFTGATSSVRGRGGAVAFSRTKFAVRGVAQSLAVEFWAERHSRGARRY